MNSMKKIVFVLFFLHFNSIFAQDTTFIKVCYNGSTAKIPEGKIWCIEKAFITSGDGFNISISKTIFKERYFEGELISFPFYISEMELLSDRNMVSYIVTIHEGDL